MQRLPGKLIKIQDMQQVNSETIEQVISSRINWDDDTGVWITISDLMLFFGLNTDRASLLACSRVIKKIKPNIASRRSNGKRLVLIPASLND